MNDMPNRSDTTAWDGRPICIACGKPYTSLRICVSLKGREKWRELCQRCRQKRRIAALKLARGF